MDNLRPVREKNFACSSAGAGGGGSVNSFAVLTGQRLPVQRSLFRNEVEICVIGQMRSGNHAVIQWLQDLYAPDPVIFLNNVEHGDRDPFDHYMQIELTGFHGDPPCSGNARNLERKVLIYSYEDRKFLESKNIGFLDSVFHRQFRTNSEKYIGKSKRRFDLVVIRDPFNFLASRLVQLRRNPLGGIENPWLIKETWKSVARKCLAFSESKSPDKIVVKYNCWIQDRSYQRQIAARLHAPFVTPRLDCISGYGGGSSFGYQGDPGLGWRDLVVQGGKIASLERWKRFHIYARRLLVRPQQPFLTRWRLLADDQEYRSLFVDREILALSERLFGRITGTRRFVAEVGGRA